MRRLERHLKDAEVEPVDVVDEVVVAVDGSGDVYVNGAHRARIIAFVTPALGNDNRIIVGGYVDGLDGPHNPELASLGDGRVEISFQRGAEPLAIAAIAYYMCGFMAPCSVSFKRVERPQVEVKGDGMVVGYPDDVVSYLLRL